MGDEVSEAREALAYINGSREYVLFDPSDDHEKELGISRQKTFNNLNETGKALAFIISYDHIPLYALALDECC